MFCPWLPAPWHHSGRLSPRAVFPSMPCRTLKEGFHVVVILTGFSPPLTSLASSSAYKTSWHLAILLQGISQLNPLQQLCTKKNPVPLVLRQACWGLFIFLLLLLIVCFVVLLFFTKIRNSQLLAGKEPVLLAEGLLRAKASGHSPVRPVQGPSTGCLPSSSPHCALCHEH